MDLGIWKYNVSEGTGLVLLKRLDSDISQQS